MKKQMGSSPPREKRGIWRRIGLEKLAQAHGLPCIYSSISHISDLVCPCVMIQVTMYPSKPLMKEDPSLRMYAASPSLNTQSSITPIPMQHVTSAIIYPSISSSIPSLILIQRKYARELKSDAQFKGRFLLPIPNPIISNIIGFISTANHAIPV